MDAFELSRVYGQGWNTARKLLADGRAQVDEAQEITLNPYRTAEERERWAKGFQEALRSRATPYNRQGRSSRL